MIITRASKVMLAVPVSTDMFTMTKTTRNEEIPLTISSIQNKATDSNPPFTIRKKAPNETDPMHLLLLADPSEQNISTYLHAGETYVAVEVEEIIGVYVLSEIAPTKVEIMNVAVTENQQGKGVGKALIQHAIQTAKNGGMTSVEIGTGNSSIQQLALYQKCGFRMSEIIHNHFVEHYEEPIFENGIQCRDMVRLKLDL